MNRYREIDPASYLSEEQLRRATELSLSIDRMAKGEVPNYPELVAVNVLTEAAYLGSLLETTEDRYGNVQYTAKMTDTKNIASSKMVGTTGLYTADKMVTVSASFTKQGEYQGIDINMTDFGKGEYKIYPDGTVVAIRDGQEDELGALRRKHLGSLLANRYFCLF